MGNLTIPTINRPNECDVITIFPMGVQCFVQNPTNDRSFDGLATLGITGGTPPYTVEWEIGSFAPALSNLGVGEYTATVIDSYGDFTATTTCVLTAETLVISGVCFIVSGVVEDQVVYIYSESIGLLNGKPHYFLQYGIQQLGYVFWNVSLSQWIFCETLDCQIVPYNTLDNGGSFYPTGDTGSWLSNPDINLVIEQSYTGPCQIPVIPKENYNLCVSLEIRDTKGEIPSISMVQIDFVSGDTINGEPSWISLTNPSYLIYWNTSSTPSQWTFTGYSPTTIFINNDPSYPPVSNWQVLGNPSILSIEVTPGTCSDGYSISVSATDNDAICGGSGSITATAAGGVPPYQYSIDGGLTYQTSPIFNGLTPGIYSVTAKDTNNVTATFGNISITNTPAQTFTLTLTTDYNNNTFSITAPTLPGGVTLNVDLVMTSILTYYPTNLVPAPNYNNVTLVDSTYTMTFTNITTNVVPVTGPCTSSGVLNAMQIQRTYTNTLTFTSNQTISGSTTNSIINPPAGLCRLAVGYYFFNITNPIVNNCNCCTLNLVNPKQPAPLII